MNANILPILAGKQNHSSALPLNVSTGLSALSTNIPVRLLERVVSSKGVRSMTESNIGISLSRSYLADNLLLLIRTAAAAFVPACS